MTKDKIGFWLIYYREGIIGFVMGFVIGFIAGIIIL